jgi:diguanylate cyclase (GGDEF)-like protein
MKKTFRDSDVFGRLGGDEFIVLLTKTTDDLVEKIIWRFKKALDSYNREANRGYDISFSEGVVTVNPDQDRSIELLLSRADFLMYEDKAEHTDARLN